MNEMRVKMMRHIIESPSYYGNRMSVMSDRCIFYLDRGDKASNKVLRDALYKTAAMYAQRGMYYFTKISGYELRKSVQGNPGGDESVPAGTGD